MIRTMIIDDEKNARDGLAICLQKYCPQIELICKCASAESALAVITDIQPELVFLDVQMPSMSGFDFLSKLDSIDFEVIFVTAHDQYAIKAIKFSALDYLLKPVDIDELITAVKRVGQKAPDNHSYHSLINNVRGHPAKLERLAIPSENRIVLQKISSIVYCEADSNYTTLHLIGEKKITVAKTLKQFENILPESDFHRIHHSTLVNLKHIETYVKGDGGYVIVKGGIELDVSRRKKEEFLQKLTTL